MGEVRVLSSAADAERFLDFVGECFAFRSVPRSLFANRLHHDPWRSDARIFVIEDATGRIVSGLLYYRREILVEVQSRLLVGAIADVCTRNDSRRQGLCKKLLLAALEDMRAQGYAGSTLHTSQMPPVYRSVGFVSVPLKFSGQIIHAHASHDCAAAVLSSPEQIEVLMKIHDAFNEHAGFNGCTRRHHPDYWTGFMKTNMQDSGWVFHRTSDTGGSREIVAFASIRTGKDQVEGFGQAWALADFFASPSEVQRDGAREALVTLVQHALAAAMPLPEAAAAGGAAPAQRRAPVKVPEELETLLRGARPAEHFWGAASAGAFAAENDEEGTMYRPLAPSAAGGVPGQTEGKRGLLEPLLSGRRHVTWALDSF